MGRATPAVPATMPAGAPARHSSSFDEHRHAVPLLTVMATAFFRSTGTTNRLPRVALVENRYRFDIA